MPAISSSAPAKIILFGEHAVVYQQPAIAVPIHQVKAKAYFFANPAGSRGDVEIIAPDIDFKENLSNISDDHPFKLLISLLANHLHIGILPALKIKIHSQIPIAAGMGSGTAISVALLRGLAQFLGKEISDDEISSLAYEVEKIYHGTPSGIDNTVITYAKPVFFIKGQLPEILAVYEPFSLVIADCGIKSKTAEVVTSVRERWEKDKARYEQIFQSIGGIGQKARKLILEGPIDQLGPLMNENHGLLKHLEVSSPILDRLTDTAISAGALGAKLSGAGVGGNMVALVTLKNAEDVIRALKKEGAAKIIHATIPRYRQGDCQWKT